MWHYSNGCFSEWLRRSKEKRSAVLCPQCRAVVHFVGKNHFLRIIAEVSLMPNYSVCGGRESAVFIIEMECAYLLMVVTKEEEMVMLGTDKTSSLIHKPKFKPYSHAQFLGKGNV